ncbi:hypothetical protein COL154_003990 [Colletotrichum chrysophilum]|uniref:uncharacterized protein n=1 Tax=Colletotrichum chrysophilum TaxID=1836956 RepID=UPI0023005AC8|nr:uncharacterized protein COL26b_010811 [Colletotrichum chrysophilum]KAJ0343942.1 hypothetical protein KNSL1_009826 [Colletotrichum chrysophilum]KAJ0366078.1 hypothetical protein COL154_003990 [Colletotrichum chrysophilum]KAJ0368528.1 hypothetical protein COL26b_010811 [Colletotrichum chrysophilum]
MAAPAHARYRYQKKPYHLPYQIKYLKLAIRIFDSDIHDILSSRQEKTMVIDDLSKELTNSEKRGPSGDCHNNRTVSLARQMQKGDKVVVKWQVCSAILRFQINLPETWLNHPTFRQCYAGASYLINCITGVNTYSQEGLQRAMYGAQSAGPQHNDNSRNAHHGRQENTDPHVNNNIGQINAAEAQHEVERQISTETNAANMQKTITELRKIMQFLPNIAASESKTFRKGILSPFITKIQSHGWNDLVRWADQLVVAKGRDSRQFVAEELRETLAARVKDLSA